MSSSPKEHDPGDIAIIGAGPAGSLAAILLAQAGREVCVLERSLFPRFVIGESLLPSCMRPLAEAGVIEHLDAQGFMIKRGVGIARGDERCDFDFAEQFHDGWQHTWQVQRAQFDQALADAAQQRGAEILFEKTVTDFQPGERPGISWRDEDGTEHRRKFRFVVDASGYGRVLARLLDLDIPSDFPPRRTVFSHVRGDIRPVGDRDGWSWVICHDGGWAWVIPFADGTTSVGIVAAPEDFSRWPADPTECLLSFMTGSPYLAQRMPEPELVFEPRVIEGFASGVKSLYGEGFCLVGNAGAFLDPIFSSGLALALESSRRAARVLVRHLDGEAVDWQAEYADPVSQGTEVFRDYVSWWYDGTLPSLFFSEAHPQIKQQICSVLAGYVWDEGNSLVTRRQRKIPQVLRLSREHASQ